MSPLQKTIKTVATILAILLAVSIVGAILMSVILLIDTASSSKKQNGKSTNVSSTKISDSSNRTSYTQSFTNIDEMDLDCAINDLTIIGDSKDNNITMELNNVSVKDKLKESNGRISYDEYKHNGINFNALKWFADFLDGGYDDDDEYDTGIYGGEVIIHVPENHNFHNLDIDAGIGDVEIQGISSSHVNIDAGTGSMDMAEVSFTDTDLDAGTGSITIDGELLGKTDIDAGTGSIDLSIYGRKDDYNVKIDKGIGELTVDGISCSSMKTRPTDAVNTLEVNAGVGNITIDFINSTKQLDDSAQGSENLTDSSKKEPETKQQAPAASDSNYFNKLEADCIGDVISIDFDVDLSGEEANFLYIEVAKDCKAVMHYSYSTQEQAGVKLGYHQENEDKNHTYKLAKAGDDAYKAIWADKTLTLKKGMNRFYVMGNSLTCKMHFEINGLDKGNVIYSGAFAKDQALENID